MTTYLIIKEEPCSNCSGEGVVTNWQWQQFWKAFPNGCADDNEFDGWWAERVSISAMGVLNIPNEEDLCPRCEGNLVTRSEVDLEQALTELGVTTL